MPRCEPRFGWSGGIGRFDISCRQANEGAVLEEAVIVMQMLDHFCG